MKEWDELVFRGEIASRHFIGFYLVEDQLKAAVGLNRGGDPEKDPEGDLAKAAELIASKAQVSKTDLRDENVDLETLLST